MSWTQGSIVWHWVHEFLTLWKPTTLPDSMVIPGRTSRPTSRAHLAWAVTRHSGFPRRGPRGTRYLPPWGWSQSWLNFSLGTSWVSLPIFSAKVNGTNVGLLSLWQLLQLFSSVWTAPSFTRSAHL